jgi:hypothetical protein
MRTLDAELLIGGDWLEERMLIKVFLGGSYRKSDRLALG